MEQPPLDIGLAIVTAWVPIYLSESDVLID